MKFLRQMILLLAVVATVSASPGDRNGRIMNGQVATPHQFPHLVAIHLIQGGNIVGVAGGSVISTTAVLTAAHAFNPSESFELVFGAVNRLINEPNQQRRSVQSSAWIFHPEVTRLNNDIAIIRFPENPLTFNSYVQPISLASDNSDRFVGEAAYVSGFGVYESNELSNVVRYTIKNVISNQLCFNFAPVIINIHICASGSTELNNSICTGDSGAPLAIRRAGEYLQVGLVSFGMGGCGNADFPDGYVRVSEFYPWIVATAEL